MRIISALAVLVVVGVLLVVIARAALRPPVPTNAPVATVPVATATDQAQTEAAISAKGAALQGTVVDLTGAPVVDAQVRVVGQDPTVGQDAVVSTGPDGAFSLPSPGHATWIRVTHPDFLPRTRAAAPGQPTVVRLTPDDGRTISLHFVGDTMFGRRYYDPDEDGRPIDGLLPLEADAEDHLALLAWAAPLLGDADLSVINMESVLAEEPYIDPTQPRPANFHPTKEFVFATDTSAPVAFRDAGVDMIDIANNHLYDGLDEGVTVTLNALEEAGFRPGRGYFGAGLSEAEAWQPAVVTLRGQSIAVLGCTSITFPFVDGEPQRDEVSYFASDPQVKGGAARCEEGAIDTAVRAAVDAHDLVIFMVHGGSEYERAPTSVLERMSRAAREAGAQLVINHQTHVVSGIDWDEPTLTAWSLGNFAFDQTVWPTFESYLLAVHVRDGEVVRAYVEPLMIEEFVPKGLTGDLAEFVGRGVAGRSMGAVALEGGAAEIDVAGRTHEITATVPLTAGAGAVYALPGDWRLADADGFSTRQAGHDLLWVGGFEDDDVDADGWEGALWALDNSTNKEIGPTYAFAGEAGMQLQHGAQHDGDRVLTTRNRIPVTAGTELSVMGMVRAHQDVTMGVQLSWFPETRGPSSTQSVIPVDVPSDGQWHPFLVDVVVPDGIIATGLFLRLPPPDTGLVTLDLDELALVAWLGPEAPITAREQFVRLAGDGTVTLARTTLPGGPTGVPPQATLRTPSPAAP